ncbi:hypothetical protein ACWFNE_00130 [Cellulomonas sp. NPDC055163]
MTAEKSILRTFVARSSLAVVLGASTLTCALPAHAGPPAPAPTGHAAARATTLRGHYEVVQAEPRPEQDLDGAPELTAEESVRRYLRDPDGERVLLEGEAEVFASLEPGQQVDVTGTEVPVDEPAADAEEPTLAVARATTVAAAPELSTDGSRATVVVLLRRGPQGAEPMTVDEVRSSVFTASSSVSGYFAESSFGTMRLTGRVRPDGDVVDYLEIPASTACWSEAEAGAAAASAAGVDLTGYDHVMYLLAPSEEPCGYGGYAGVGGNVSVTLHFGEEATRGIAQHELGHNLGLWHAHSLTCTDAWGRFTSGLEAGGRCETHEYGDPYDTMGDAYGHMHFSANHKVQLGWIPPSRVTTAATSGTYTVAAAGIATDAPQSLRVPLADGAYYDVEVRRPVGQHWDAKVAGIPSLLTGVSVRLVDGRGQALVDATPDGWMGDSAVQPGSVLTDPTTGASVRLVSSDSTTAAVEVTHPAPIEQLAVRGTNNGWGSTPMTRVAGSASSWTAEVPFGTAPDERFKLDVHGDWSESYGDSDRDGRAERDGADIPVTGGAGTYRITFDALAKTYTVVKTGFTSTHPSMHLRGTHNAWNAAPMSLVGDGTWSVAVWLGGTDDARLKFDVDGTWATSFGDTDRDGRAEQGGADIPVTGGVGLYYVTFDDRTGEYHLIKWG